MAEVRKASAAGHAPQHDVLAGPQVRPPEIPRDLARRDARVQELAGRDGPAAPAGRAHGERGPDPSRPARPRVRARGGRSPADARSRGAALAATAREAVLEEVIYPYNRLFGQYKKPEELWGLAAKARERFGATLTASAASEAAQRRAAPRLRGLRAGVRGAARVVVEAEPGRLARALDPAPARAQARAARHAAGARRHPLPRAGDAARRRQPGLLLERAAVAAHAAPQHPRGPGLPRALAPRLRRRGPRRRRRHRQLLHHGRGLLEGAHRARARVRQRPASCPPT